MAPKGLTASDWKLWTHVLNRNITIIVFATGLAAWTLAHSEQATASRDLKITLQSDGEHCLVDMVTILCSDLANHLRNTLKLPYTTTIYLRAGRGAHYEAVKRVLTIIENSGFSYPVGRGAGSKQTSAK